MVMWYNLTSINATNVLILTQSINTDLTFGWLGTSVLVVLWFISFISMNYYWSATKLNFTVASFFMAILSMFFVILGLVPNYLPFLVWGLFVLGVISILLEK